MSALIEKACYLKKNMLKNGISALIYEAGLGKDQ